MARGFSFGLALSALLLAGCSQSAVNILNTGSLGGSAGQATPAAAPAAPVVTPADRALQVAATSARAQKCGYNFDPEQLKVSYLNFETSAGLNPEGLAGVARLYDYTNQRIATTIASDKTYCSEQRTAGIKKQLAKYLAGDYTPPPKKKTVQSNWLEQDEPTGKTKINPNWWDKGEKMTIPAE